MFTLSLLWPPEKEKSLTQPLPAETVRDLALEKTLDAFATDRQTRQDVSQVLLELTTDPAVILYRQAILQDLLDFPAVTSTLAAILPNLEALGAYRQSIDRQKVPLQALAWRASELEYLVEAVTALDETLAPLEEQIQSTGLHRLLETVRSLRGEPTFRQLEKELPAILPRLRSNLSVTIGVNLDRQLRPIEAVLVAVNEEKYAASPLIERLLGRQSEWRGIAPLHRAAEELAGIDSDHEIFKKGFNPLLAPLFKDLANVLARVVKPIEEALQRFLHLNGDILQKLRPEINYYLAAVRMIEGLRDQGLPMCRPEIRPAGERICRIEQSFNLNLARHMMGQQPGIAIGPQIILNDILLDDRSRVQILTGPNQGGKTTYTQMVGLNQLLAQAGLLIPGRAGQISPADHILTHFPHEEKLESGAGRFGEEARRLAAVFENVTAESLVLFNESLSSTSPGESIYLAQDLVRILRQVGARAIFNTHLHQLAQSIEELNEESPGNGRVASLVASRIDPSEGGLPGRSYRVAPGPPLGRSYAEEIAAVHGISYEQLLTRLGQRGIIEPKKRSDSTHPPAD